MKERKRGLRVRALLMILSDLSCRFKSNSRLNVLTCLSFIFSVSVFLCVHPWFQTAVHAAPGDGHALTGIDVLEAQKFAPLAGKRVGLITNQTGIDRNRRSTIDLLAHAPGVKLLELFSPEHGIRVAVDDRVASAKDEATGLPIYSLYGEDVRPTDAMLEG